MIRIRGNLIIDDTEGAIIPVQQIKSIFVDKDLVFIKTGESESSETGVEVPGKNQHEIIDNAASAYLEALINYGEMLYHDEEEEEDSSETL
ncbi:MAG: hypothetical protein JXR73_06840 [Candidatus Omnitrophica bacterium]|nr:hypothetical protein [Candidatus Omnitrophota bacterium]